MSGPLKQTFTVVVLSVLFFFVNLALIYHYVQTPAHTYPSGSDQPSPSALCNVTSELAKSALDRAKTKSCQTKIHQVACSFQTETHPEVLPESTCHAHDNLLKNLHVGCFSDSVTARVLKDYKYELQDNSLERCQYLCYRAGFLYFGLEYGRECFCGDTFNATSKNEAECQSYPCSGNFSQKCGGFNAVDVYRTGLRDKGINSKARYVELGTNSNNPVKILFLLQFNGRNERQVKRLLKSIYSPRHVYYIHVDQRQTYMLSEMLKVAALLPNVYVVPNGRSTIWGGASLLSMVLDIVRSSLEHDGFSDWDYLVNLSESDFPVLSLEELEQQLSSNPGQSYLASHGYNAADFIRKQGFDFIFVECEERMWRVGQRNTFPLNVRLDGGSDWIILHHEFARYAISDEDLPLKLRDIFSNIILPVESFFHTLSLNSRFCSRTTSSHLRLTNWNRKQGCRCASLKKVVDWCGCSPLVFKKEHTYKFALESVVKKAQYIARKFESLVDIDAIAMAEAQSLRNRNQNILKHHPSFNATFVCLHKADTDGYSKPNSLLAQALWNLSRLEGTFQSLVRVDLYKKHSSANEQLVFSIQIHEHDTALQLLVEVNKFRTVANSVANGFELIDAEFGLNFDHKEEFFRGAIALADKLSSPTIALKWRRRPEYPTTLNDTKTSPSIKYIWKDSTDKLIATQSLPPYDSINSRQFAALELPTLKSNPSPGRWKVQVTDDNGAFTPDIVSEFYRIIDHCLNCHSTVWSISYPDPKSDIIHGYNSDSRWLY